MTRVTRNIDKLYIIQTNVLRYSPTNIPGSQSVRQIGMFPELLQLQGIRLEPTIPATLAFRGRMAVLDLGRR